MSESPAPGAAIPPARVVAELLPKLRSERLAYFPIRHHSPACAAHLRRWIQARQPASVLVEGPASFTALVEHLTDPACVCPVAFYTCFVDTKGRTRGGEGGTPFGPPRFAAYYPFCDYSPELVALRAGKAAGARLRFIDLEYGEMVLARQDAESGVGSEGVRVDSLAAEPHLRHSEYVKALARNLGCRDFNDLWDHLFESSPGGDTDAFIDRLATYCALARLDYSDEHLRRDGTLAREACMASAIREELRRNEAEGRTGPVLVVTGGFHTAALPDLVNREISRPPAPAFAEGEVGNWLMRYSFDQLDALAGYASGMPSPAFYERLWLVIDREGDGSGMSSEAGSRIAADVLLDVARLARARQLPNIISTPDAIAAVRMAGQLALLRGRPWPLREDVLDGVRSCFVKGEMGVEGQLLLRLVREVLAGDRVGNVPPGTPLPPLVADFLAEARRLRLPVDTVERREMALDLYRNAGQRQMSRLFHRLNLLEIPFAVFVKGPDFVTGHGLDLMQEHWQVCWSPGTESALIEASVFGATVEEAAAARLRAQIARLEEEGEGRCTAIAVTLLVRACRLGLHREADGLVPLIDAHCAEDPSLPSVAAGLSQLELLAHSREPLEAAGLTALPRLTSSAYQRACRLVNDVGKCPDEAVDPVVEALKVVREVLASATQTTRGQPEEFRLDGQLFHAGLRRLADQAPAETQAAVVGAALGILSGEGLLSEEELVCGVAGYLGGTSANPRKSTGVLRGLLATARESVWQATGLVRAIDAQFRAWDEKTFLTVLPELRLAFTGLTPREIARVADHVARAHGETSLGELVHADLDEAEVQLALAVTQRVREALRADGLM